MLRTTYLRLVGHRALCQQQLRASSTNDEQKTSVALERIRQELIEDKKNLDWRTKYRTGQWESKFKLFADMDQNSDFLVMMQQPIDFSPAGIKNFLERRKEHVERQMQSYISERVEILGADLAAAHFILFRGGSVKFTNGQGWMRADENREFKLPNKYEPRYKVEGLRCDNMLLYYEGLENIRSLDQLKFLSFHNVKVFDDWCLDRVSGAQYPRLEVLDISGTKCTLNGLACLYRIPTLKLLIVDDPKQTLEYELSCAMLEEAVPNLNVVKAEVVHS